MEQARSCSEPCKGRWEASRVWYNWQMKKHHGFDMKVEVVRTTGEEVSLVQCID